MSGLTISARRVQATAERLLDPEAAEWKAAAGHTVPLQPTPIGLQNAPYIQAAWKGRPYGRTKALDVRVLTNGSWLLLRLSWPAARRVAWVTDDDVFPDAAGVLFPLDGRDAPLIEMGSPEQPVNAWYWRADVEKPANIIATGRGTTSKQADSPLAGRGLWQSGVWEVAIGRPLDVAGAAAAPLAAVGKVKVAFAVWEGANQERVGLKAYSPEWHELVIEG